MYSPACPRESILLNSYFCLCSLCPHKALSTLNTSKPGSPLPFSLILRTADHLHTPDTSSATSYQISSEPCKLPFPVHAPQRILRLSSLSSCYFLWTRAQYSQAHRRTLHQKRASALWIGMFHRLLPVLLQWLHCNSSTWRGTIVPTRCSSFPRIPILSWSTKRNSSPIPSPLSSSIPKE